MPNLNQLSTKQRFGLLVGAVVLVVGQTLNAIPAQAYTHQDYLDNLQKQVELKEKIDQTKGQERTLAGEISRLNNQVELNELELESLQSQIHSTEELLTKVNGDIDDLSVKLGRLDEVIVQMQEAAEGRIQEVYKRSRTPAFVAVVSAEDFKQAIQQLAYLEQMAEADSKLLAEINTNRESYSKQKEELATLKSEKETLAADLANKQRSVEAKQVELGEVKASRAAVLDRTRGDEQVFQNLLAQAQAEASAMASALSTGQSFQVERGQVIGFVGMSGCTSGPHLHFGYRRVNRGTRIGATIAAGSWINPRPYIDNGTIGVPLEGYPGNITQNFGVDEVGIYGAGGHPAMDMARPMNTPIRAAQSGWAQKMTDGGCPGYGWLHHGPGKGIIITGHDGTQTLYWHLN